MKPDRQAAWPEGVPASYLLHPETLEAYPCVVRVSRRGLSLVRFSAGSRARVALRIPWRAVSGFVADESGESPDGLTWQVLEVVTDAGTLTLLVPAPEVSALVASIAPWAHRWTRSRRPGHAAVARVLALVLAALAVAFHALARVSAPARHWFAGTALGAATIGLWRRFGSTPVAAAAGRRRIVAPALVGVLALALVAVIVSSLGVDGPSAAGDQEDATAPVGNAGISTTPMLGSLRPHQSAPSLAPATAPPEPAPPSLANAAPLQSHEVFGFAPYWTLNQSAGFDVSAMTTLAYFSIGVNPDGSLDQSDAGWAGYESQALATLVTRAHAAGSRVVLTVSCFSQSSLDQLTSSPTVPTTLSNALIAAVEAKNLDGVNLDFEGEGGADQVGLTHLVTVVSAAVKAANPHYQVTMDTYASSAGDSQGFYNIAALAPAVDGFFVMAYELNLQGTSSANSPLTSGMFSDLTTLRQYTAVVPAAKVILGIPYYGYDWPTTDGSLTATATGGATPVAYSQVAAGNHPVYWDPVTDTAWTSFQIGSQWHEQFFENPTSLYMVAELAQLFHVGGLGIWALGFDGNSQAMLGALLGFSPAAKTGLAGPTAVPANTTTTSSSTTTTSAPVGPTTTSAPSADPTTTAAPTPVTSAPGTTTTTAGGGSTLWYSGTWSGQSVALTRLTSPPTNPTYVGQLTGFQTNDPTLTCLESESALSVYETSATATQLVLMADQPTDCATASFTFAVPSSSGSTSSSR